MTPRPSSDQTWQPIDSRVVLIVLASATATDVLEVTLRQLEVHGVDYHLGRHVETHYRYLAGIVEQHLEDLRNAFDIPDITAVWCLRDGYGCGQLLPGLDWGRLQAVSPWPLIGFSDISVLLSALYRHGLPVIHGSMAIGLGLSPLNTPREQQERLASPASVSRSPARVDHELLVQHLDGHKQRVESALIGGNLIALACMAGIPGDLHASVRSILVLEDAGEPYHRPERNLWQLLENIDARQFGAICLGSFTDCPRKEVAHSLERILGEYAAAVGVPPYHHLPNRHGAQNRAWFYGKTAVLEGNRLRW